MGKYEEVAQRIVKLAACRDKKVSEEQGDGTQIAKTLAENAQELVEDFNAALSARKLEARMKVKACPLESQGLCAVLRISVTRDGSAEDILVTISLDGSHVTAAG
jgi:hypothetical protein